MIVVIKLIFISLFVYSMQENYDEDINRPYPVTIYYRQTNVQSPREVLSLENMNNCTCKVLAMLDAHCSGTSCKIFPSYINTTAKYFKLKLTSIKTINQDDFLLLNNILSLDINANVLLSTIQQGCFRKMSNLKNLSLVANVNLKYLHPKVFEGLINVEQMYFQKNGFNEIKDITISLSPKYVPQLEILDLSESMFYKINYNDFHSMNNSKLFQLNLILCELETVHSNSLLPLRNLSKLLLGQNNFNITSLTNVIHTLTYYNISLDYLSLYDIGIRKDIPIDLMYAISQSTISSLSLASNHFDNIGDTDFPEMPNLIDLDLRQTYIEDISENAFKKLTALKILRLGENKLFSVPKGALVQQLTYLDLAGNTIEGVYFSMQDAIFSQMKNLLSLQLSYNLIFCLTNQSFVGLKNLKKLNLKKSGLSHIDDGTFFELENLLQLNLMENHITQLNYNTFLGLSNLEVLLLGGCSLNNLTSTPTIFKYLTNLKYLGLEKNNLHTIYPQQLNHLDNLNTLNLDDNRLGSWYNNRILPKNLKIFFGQQNKISYLTTVMLEDLKFVREIYLDGNPFGCDCTLYPTLIWFNKEGIILEDFVEREDMIARCIFPEIWRQKSVIQFLKHMNNTDECVSYRFSGIFIELIFIVIILCTGIILFCIYKKYSQKTDCK